MMLMGLIGAHRTGKTTTARALAEHLGVPFCETNLSQALQDLGVDPKADMPFMERLTVQNALLEALVASYMKTQNENPNASLIVTDRTPIDVAAYTLAEVQRQTINPVSNYALERHFTTCSELFGFSFVMGALIQPGIPLVDDPGKAPVNAMYQAHINACMIERTFSLCRNVPVRILPKDCLQIESRVSDISHIFHSIMTLQRHDQTGDDHTSSPSVH